MTAGLGPALGVVLETGFQIGAQLRQGGLVAGLLGEGVVEGGQLPVFEVFEADLEAGRSTGGVLLGVALGELAVDGFAVAHRHADHALNEARDHAALLQLHLHGIAATAADRLVGVGVNAAEAEHRHVATGGRAALHRHQGGELLARLLDQLVHAGGVVGDRFGLGLEPLGGLEAGGGLDVELQGDRERAAGFEALQHGLKALAQLRPADGRHRLLLQGVAEGGIHQVFQGGGPDAQGADLLQQHRAGHLALAEAGQLDAAAQLLHGRVVAGLAAAAGDGHLQGHAAARAGGGLDGQRGGGGGRAHGKQLQPFILETDRSEL